MRTLLKSKLNQHYFTVIAEASNGQEAIEKFKTFSPDIVLMDVIMPKVTGIEALKEIMHFNPSAKIVVCSSMGQQSLIIEALTIGAKDYIVKPNFDNINEILFNL